MLSVYNLPKAQCVKLHWLVELKVFSLERNYVNLKVLKDEFLPNCFQFAGQQNEKVCLIGNTGLHHFTWVQIFIIFTSHRTWLAFWKTIVPKFSKLRNLTLLLDKVPASLTAQTAIAILRNSNLDEFNCLTPLKFTVLDQVESLITHLVKSLVVDNLHRCTLLKWGGKFVNSGPIILISLKHTQLWNLRQNKSWMGSVLGLVVLLSNKTSLCWNNVFII